MKLKYLVVMALLLSAASACSDDDSEGMDDPCLNACNKLSVCGTGVACSGVTLGVSDCTSRCQRRQAAGAANCIIQVPNCVEIDKLQSCAAGMPCS